MEEKFRNVNSKIELSMITEADKTSYFNSLHTKYESYYYGLNRDSLNIKEYFSWIDKKMNINIIYFTNRNKDIGKTSFFTYTTDNEDGKTIIHDLIDVDLPMSILIHDGILNSRRFLAELIESEYIKGIRTTDVNAIYGVLGGIILVDLLFNQEYNFFEANLEEGYPVVNFSDLKLYKKIYDYEDIIREINDQQFEHELLECLFAYERGKYFICAAGMGSVIEHLIYLATYKHVSDEKDENGKPRIIIDESSTANEYIAQLGKNPFNAKKRDKTLLKNIFADRNSVSHFNKGHFSKSMCDRLLEGLSMVFHKYYMYNSENS